LVIADLIRNLLSHGSEATDNQAVILCLTLLILGVQVQDDKGFLMHFLVEQSLKCGNCLK
jgi:hypothetical protein